MAFHALNDSNRALVELLRLRSEFEPDHPEFLPLIDVMGQMQLMFQEALGDFFVAAWGRRPEEFPASLQQAVD